MTDLTTHDLRGARARTAYDDVVSWTGRWRRDAAQQVKSLPIDVRTQGLMVTLATLMSDNQEASRHLAELLARWLLTDAPHRTLTGAARETRPSPSALLEACARATRGEYAAAQRETILLFEQLKLYADALVKKDD